MLFRTHILFSLAVYFLLSYYIKIPLYVLIFILLSTAIVDVDVKSSRAGNRWYLQPFRWFTKHRGFMHSIFVGLFISLLIGLINLWAGFGFFVGYVSHLFLDCFTRGGVELFWPFEFKIKGFIRSGGIFEHIIFILLLLVDVYLLLKIAFGYLF